MLSKCLFCHCLTQTYIVNICTNTFDVFIVLSFGSPFALSGPGFFILSTHQQVITLYHVTGPQMVTQHHFSHAKILAVNLASQCVLIYLSCHLNLCLALYLAVAQGRPGLIRPSSFMKVPSLACAMSSASFSNGHVSLIEDRPYFTPPYLFFAGERLDVFYHLASLLVNDTRFSKGSHYFHSHLRAHAHCGFTPVRRDRLYSGLRRKVYLECTCTLYLIFSSD